MAESLPPLNALRSFEMAGRHLNIARAAQELGVSSGAISQQVHALEKWIGCRLFQRSNRGLSFTEAGQLYFEAISKAMDEIRGATRSVGRPEIRKNLIISVTASFAMKFLLPRLTDFRSLWPDLDISVSTVELVNEFNPSDGDVGIRYGHAHQANMWTREILRDELMLVASATLQGVDGRPLSLENFTDFPLLMDKHPSVIQDYPSWQEFLKNQGVEDTSHLNLREFSQQWMVIEAAINGEGVALAKKCLVHTDIASGKLVAIGAQQLSLNSGYYLLTLPENANDPIIKSFYRWIEKTVAAL
ncbi:LysR substrate-binding domain-containing protein [Sneathiella aquimaris]|uniref:LysR substrate-binding domain-containing protein n=1 Tax=Sneathiella aquimaris TaxID=2599305 RepID=UPI00146D6AAB|nr:LysR substrate-binding domain-containing protein [Sneathiella aquimaris]